MEKCQHCGNMHESRCPSIKAIEYFPDGSIKRVEYMTPSDIMGNGGSTRGIFDWIPPVSSIMAYK